MVFRDDKPSADITLLRVRDSGVVSSPAEERDDERHAAAGIASLPATGHTPLFRASRVLLSLAAALRGGADIDDLERLHAQAMVAVRRFDEEATQAGIDARTTATTRYVLCTMLDEAVLHVASRDSIHWRRQTLLFVHHGDTYGGDTFFVIMDRVLSDIGRHIDLAEVIYACLALGFGGRYLVEDGGKARLERRRDLLHRQIVACRGHREDALSPHWQGATRPLRSAGGPRPLPVVACAAGAILLAWAVLRWVLGDVRDDTEAYLRVATRPFVPPQAAAGPPSPLSEKPVPATKAPGPTLAGLLATDPAREHMHISEDAEGRTTVRLTMPGLFRSGGADLAASQHDTVRRVAMALDRLRGAVRVVGHTDDQPIHTARYRDNVELSEARARTVAAFLVAHLAEPGRVSSHGAGDSSPVAIPPSLPEHRLRNRRVDIVFLPEAR